MHSVSDLSASTGVQTDHSMGGLVNNMLQELSIEMDISASKPDDEIATTPRYL